MIDSIGGRPHRFAHIAEYAQALPEGVTGERQEQNVLIWVLPREVGEQRSGEQGRFWLNSFLRLDRLRRTRVLFSDGISDG